LPLITAASPEQPIELAREQVYSDQIPPAPVEFSPLRTSRPANLPISTGNVEQTEVAAMPPFTLPGTLRTALDEMPGAFNLQSPPNENPSVSQSQTGRSEQPSMTDPDPPGGGAAPWSNIAVHVIETADSPQNWLGYSDALVRGRPPSLPVSVDRFFMRVDSPQSNEKKLAVVEASAGIQTFPPVSVPDSFKASELRVGSIPSDRGAEISNTVRTLLREPESAFQLRIEPQGQQEALSREGTDAHPLVLKQVQRGASGISNLNVNPEVARTTPRQTVMSSVPVATTELPGVRRTASTAEELHHDVHLLSGRKEPQTFSTQDLLRNSVKHSSTTGSEPDAAETTIAPHHLSVTPQAGRRLVTAEMPEPGITLHSGVSSEPGDRRSETQPAERSATEPADANKEIHPIPSGPLDRSPIPITSAAESLSIHSPQPEETRGRADTITSTSFSEPPPDSQHLSKDRVTEIKVEIPTSDTSHVQVKLRESRGQILLDVKAADGPTRVALRDSLPELVRSLDHQGFTSTHASGVSQQQIPTSDRVSESAPSGDMSHDRGQQHRNAQEQLMQDKQDRRGTHQQAWERWMEQITWRAQFNQ
jgi:hypothetical protein